MAQVWGTLLLKPSWLTDLLSTAAVWCLLYAPSNKDLHPPAGGTCVWLSSCLRSQFQDSHLLLCDPTISSLCLWIEAQAVVSQCAAGVVCSEAPQDTTQRFLSEYINCAVAAAVAWLIQLHLLRNPHGLHLNKTQAVIKFLLEHSGGFGLSRRGRRHLVV